MNPRPLRNAAEAVALARSLVGTGTYVLGTGNDDTPVGGDSDCCGFATCKAYGIKRHRPGFNRGADASRGDVEDDINCNSSIDDATRSHDLFYPVERIPGANPEPGDLLKWPTIHLAGHSGAWVGHECIVESNTRLLEWMAAGGAWDWAHPRFDLLDVIHCHGPNGQHPAIERTTGAMWAQHTANWSKPEHRSWCLRVVV